MKLLPVFLVILACACSMAPPNRETAPAAVGVAEATYPALTVAVVPTGNTTRARAYAASFPGLPVDSLFAQFEAALARSFGKVLHAAGKDEALRLHPDAVLMFDLYAQLPDTRNVLTAKAKLDVTVDILDADGSPVDAIAFKHLAKGSMFSSNNPARDRIVEAFRDSAARLPRELAASAKLRDYAARRQSQPKPAETGPATVAAAGPSSAVDEPKYQRPERPDDVAVVIGIEKYESLPPAEYAERDAAAVRRHLLAQGYPERNVAILVGRSAGRAGIEKYLESWLPQRTTPNSRVFVYFSGHGAPNPTTGQAFLVPWDGDPKFIDNTGYPVSRLYEKLSALKAREVVVALDSCFSGAGGRSVLARGVRPLVMHLESGVPSGNLRVLTASGGDEVTGTAQSEGHGLFTYFLLTGLAESKGDSDIASLYKYLLPKVQDWARRDNRDQTPQLLPR